MGKLRMLLSIALSYLGAKVVIKILHVLRGMRNRHEHLMKLPQLITNEKNDNWIRGPTMHKSIVPDDIDASKLSLDEAHKRYFLGFLRRTIQQHMRTVPNKEEDEMIFALWLARNDLHIKHGFAVVIPYGIELARLVLASKEQHNYKKGLNYVISEPLVGNSVLAAHGKSWARQRIVVDKCFTKHMMSMSLPGIYETLTEFCVRTRMLANESGAKERGIDMTEESARLILEMFGRVAFSYEFGSLTANTNSEAPLYHAFETILETLVLRGRRIIRYATRGLPFPSNIEFNTELDKINQVVEEIVKERLKAANKVIGTQDPSCPKDLLDALLSTVDNKDRIKWQAVHRTTREEDVYPVQVGPSSRLTEKELAENVRLFLFAGRDTTSAAFSWLIYLMAKHPKCAGRVRSEIEMVCGTLDASMNPTLEQLEACKYLNACVKETLRLYPSASFTRTTTENVQLGRYTIPSGVEILIAPYLIQRNPKYFENPNQFNPDRWMNTLNSSAPNTLPAEFAADYRNKGLLPFSGGPRNCVGRPLALLELRASLVKVLQSFHVSLPRIPDPKYEEDPVVSLTMAPQSIRVVFTAIK